VDGITRPSEGADRCKSGPLLTIGDYNGQRHSHVPVSDCLLQHSLIGAKVAAVYPLDDSGSTSRVLRLAATFGRRYDPLRARSVGDALSLWPRMSAKKVAE
jgi:hypothetical protein